MLRKKNTWINRWYEQILENIGQTNVNYEWHTNGPEHSLCFDDILLIPQYSELNSRKDPSIVTNLGNITLGVPIIPSVMDSITSPNMITTMSQLGGICILTRYIKQDEGSELNRQLSEIEIAKRSGANKFGCAIGISPTILNCKINRLAEIGCSIICIDVQHADHKRVYEAIESILEIKSKNRLNFHLMVGNICTKDAALRLARAGVDSIKIGTGAGAICSTRIVTGFGVPQFTAIKTCHEALVNHGHRDKVAIIGDGGVKNTGHMTKGIYAGADAIMCGYMFAGSSDTPMIGGKHIYRGMSSFEVSGRKDVHEEGVCREISPRGNTKELVQQFCMGIKAGLAMAGAKNIQELRKCDYNLVTPLSVIESGVM